MNPVSSALLQAVANTASLTFLSLVAHWNVTGPDFFQLHAAFGSQYESLFDTLDLLAERIRALGDTVPVDMGAFQKVAAMPVIAPTFSARGMVDALIVAHTKNVADLKGLAQTAREAGDITTENMVLSIIESEEKTLWMLKSYGQ